MAHSTHLGLIKPSGPNWLLSAAQVTHGVDGVDELAGFAELHEALPQVVQGSLHQHLLLLVVIQEVIPEGLLGQGFGVPHNDHPVPVEGRGATVNPEMLKPPRCGNSPWALMQLGLFTATIPDVAQQLEGACCRQFLLQAPSVSTQTPRAGLEACKHQGSQAAPCWIPPQPLCNQTHQKNPNGHKMVAGSDKAADEGICAENGKDVVTSKFC